MQAPKRHTSPKVSFTSDETTLMSVSRNATPRVLWAQAAPNCYYVFGERQPMKAVTYDVPGSFCSFLHSTSWFRRMSLTRNPFAMFTDERCYRSSKPRVFLLDRFSLLFNIVAIPLIAYCSMVHQLIFGAQYEFLPLMFISSYTATGVFGSWVGMLVVFFTT